MNAVKPPFLDSGEKNSCSVDRETPSFMSSDGPSSRDTQPAPTNTAYAKGEINRDKWYAEKPSSATAVKDRTVRSSDQGVVAKVGFDDDDPPSKAPRRRHVVARDRSASSETPGHTVRRASGKGTPYKSSSVRIPDEVTSRLLQMFFGNNAGVQITRRFDRSDNKPGVEISLGKGSQILGMGQGRIASISDGKNGKRIVIEYKSGINPEGSSTGSFYVVYEGDINPSRLKVGDSVNATTVIGSSNNGKLDLSAYLAPPNASAKNIEEDWLNFTKYEINPLTVASTFGSSNPFENINFGQLNPLINQSLPTLIENSLGDDLPAWLEAFRSHPEFKNISKEEFIQRIASYLTKIKEKKNLTWQQVTTLVALLPHITSSESRHQIDVKSRAGAVGLMQLMPATATEHGVLDRTNPGQNVNGGLSFLADLIKLRGNDIGMILAGYNAGQAYNSLRDIPEDKQKETIPYILEKVYPKFLETASVLSHGLGELQRTGSMPTLTQPTLFDIPGESIPWNGKTIVLDAGHGHDDPGAIGEISEASAAGEITARVKAKLERLGYRVILTNRNQRAGNRSKILDQYPGALCISLHLNSGGEKSTGHMAFHQNSEYSRLLAASINGQLTGKDLGVGKFQEMTGRDFDLAMLKTQNTATLVELGFVTDPKYVRYLVHENGFEKEAQRIVTGIQNFRETIASKVPEQQQGNVTVQTYTKEKGTGSITFAQLPTFFYPLSQQGTSSSPFGPRDLFGRKFHSGTDITVPTGTEVVYNVPGQGTVMDSGYSGSAGYHVKIASNTLTVYLENGEKKLGRIVTTFLHLQGRSPLPVGSTVQTLDVVAKSGNTGDSTGPHLDVRHQIVPVDGSPSFYFNATAFTESTPRQQAA